jgi:hypothetical protein
LGAHGAQHSFPGNLDEAAGVIRQALHGGSDAFQGPDGLVADLDRSSIDVPGKQDGDDGEHHAHHCAEEASPQADGFDLRQGKDGPTICAGGSSLHHVIA